MGHYQPARLTLRLLSALLFLTGCQEHTDVVVSSHGPVAISKAMTQWQTGKMRPAVEATEQLVVATHKFLEAPGEELQHEWQAAWIAAHERFLAASILHQPDATSSVDPWPIEPGFLDSLPDYPTSGLVNDDTLQMNSTTLREQHQITDDAEVALGFHVIEYYSFARKPEEFSGEDVNAGKRTQLVALVADLLLLDVTTFFQTQANVFESGEMSYSLLVSQVQKRVQSLFSEFNLLGEHSPYSETSTRNIRIQLTAIAELLDKPVGLNHYLIELHPEAATTFNNTLTEALMLLPQDGSPDEAAFARLMLLIASLSQQLGDFVAKLPAQGEI